VIISNPVTVGSAIHNEISDNCKLSDWDVEKTIFNSCDFWSPRFESVQGDLIGSVVLIDSKFSNSKKSMEFEREVYFLDIFNQINEMFLK
jgi:hypothetical protein